MLELVFQRVVIISPFREGKWFVSHDLYPYDYYPDYCYGPFYALSFSNLFKIVHNIENVPYFDIEDVYLTGLVAEKVSGMLLSIYGVVLNLQMDCMGVVG